MSDTITLTGIAAIGYHGVFPEERRDGQRFVVDVVLHADLAEAGKSDDLATTINYAEVAQQIVAAIEGEPLDLIEALAQRIADRCLSFARVAAVEITVHKPQAPVGVEFTDIAVTIHRKA